MEPIEQRVSLRLGMSEPSREPEGRVSYSTGGTERIPLPSTMRFERCLVPY
jgi:hypothetical protein